MPIRLRALSWQIKLKWQEFYQKPDPMYNTLNYMHGSSPWRQKPAAFVTVSAGLEETLDSKDFMWTNNAQH